MKKFLLALVLVAPILLIGCTSAENHAKKEIAKRMEAGVREDAGYKIGDCIFSADNDSCFIFNGEITYVNGVKADVEYLYQQYEDDLLIAIKNLEISESLLRNTKNISSSGNSQLDIAFNNALEKSDFSLYTTIYNDLQEGSLMDITDMYKD